MNCGPDHAGGARPARAFSRFMAFCLVVSAIASAASSAVAQFATASRYPAEPDLLEVMFAAESQVRLRGATLVDLRSDALQGVDAVLARVPDAAWLPFSDVSEATLDELHERGVANTREPLYNLNNMYRLRFDAASADLDAWELGARLEALPGVLYARPVPLPMQPPLPPDYQPSQNYEDPAAAVPAGVDAEYAWTKPGGDGTGVTICDIEYSWNYNHQDITKALGSQINVNVVDPFGDTNHGTAVLGEMVSDDNGWGTKGVCYGADVKTCGSYYGLPGPSWNVAGAIALAVANLQQGDIILLEQQWDYTGGGGYVPVEWWGSTTPQPQVANPVYTAIQNAVAAGIHVVEAGGNGNVNTGALVWLVNSGAIIVGAGGAYPGGTWPQGNLERLSFSSYGPRFDLQGWGENVVTTGYGNLFNAEGVNRYYTATFSGTSSASPIVAGALACVLAWHRTNINPGHLPPSFIRMVMKSTGTPQVFGLAGAIGPRPNLLNLMNALTPTVGSDLGDAPEGQLAYPSLGVIGDFPTCQDVGNPNSFVLHFASDSVCFGGTVDFESDGNWFNCPAFPPYDADECWNQPESGLILPPAYTIDAGLNVVPCDPSQVGFLGAACTDAYWGGNVDILVTNLRAEQMYVNVLIDWDQDGTWNGGDFCNGNLYLDHVAVDVPVPPQYTGPLSALVGTSIRIGPNDGYVWSRFMISEQPVGLGWNGQGIFVRGETSDFLLAIDENPTSAGEVEAGFTQTRLVAGSPNPFRGETTIRAEIAAKGRVEVTVYDVAGRVVRSLFDGERLAGGHDFAWDGRDAAGRTVSPGVYFVRLKAGATTSSLSITLMR